MKVGNKKNKWDSIANIYGPLSFIGGLLNIISGIIMILIGIALIVAGLYYDINYLIIFGIIVIIGGIMNFYFNFKHTLKKETYLAGKGWVSPDEFFSSSKKFEFNNKGLKIK